MSMMFPKHHPMYASHLESVELARQEGDLHHLEMLEEDIRPIVEMLEEAWQRIRAACQVDVANLIGIELRNERIDQWAAILADPSEPGRYRAQYYAANGFHGHATYDSLEEVLCELLQEGFRQLAGGAMQTLSQTKSWADGMFYAELIRKVNCGQLSYAEANREYEHYRQAC